MLKPLQVTTWDTSHHGIKTAPTADLRARNRRLSVTARLDSDRQGLTSRRFQLGPRESVHLLVDAFIGIGEPAGVIDWWLRFHLDTNQGLRSRRHMRVPGGRKYRLVGRRRSFRIVNDTVSPRFSSAWNADATAFTWQRQPSIPVWSEPDWGTA